ncbi:hypothetical protein BXT86_03020 [candidate division WOR-3 bacterium 4484_100]|uniref:FAD-binding PCMH-type domain-containing protein n=1 Tax=candidate division WOR-3 bacterium 4484_100 TaxID=1936077 RepID=A0A1V4QFF2_UNCW3|nr:MAG: hypothetical protein BXT86_03020 [candidate division WOR-3 bacterium 4484_100]
MPYMKIDDKIINQLSKILQTRTRVIQEPEILENYAHDETPLYHSMPEVVIKPETTKEVSEIVKLGYEYNIPITPRGGGTSLSAGAVPLFGGIVLSFERMDKIKEVDQKNLTVTTEPGIITEKLDQELKKYNLFFPPDPVSLDSCTIGGNIAECAGGPRAMKYGVTRNYVLGLEIVAGTGEIIKLGGKLLKNVTGYDLINLIVGSEGTLAIVTQAILKLLPRPRVVVDLLIPFPLVSSAVEFAITTISQAPQVAAIEFIEGDVIRLLGRFLKKRLPYPEAGAHIIVEIDGDCQTEVRRIYENVGDIALKNSALDVLVAEGEKDKERIWEPRRNIGDALKELTKNIAREDLVVPKDRVPQLIKEIKAMLKSYNAQLYAFGHLGDGNIHTDIGIEKGQKINRSKVNEIRKNVYKIALNLGGTITAEHGIGLSKIAYLPMAIAETNLQIMKEIKRIFDPKNILNPGKIFQNNH